MGRLALYAIFHLNMAYSAIEEALRREVINRCYWPLLRLIRQYRQPLAVEASGYTLEVIAGLDSEWIEELRSLTLGGTCEFIGSGYAQIIGPLVPAKVNTVNLEIGHQVYERLLGYRPPIALVNEQAYSAGLVDHYLDAGYEAIIMEWNNCFRYHPEWLSHWRYLPQLASNPQGRSIPLIWNDAIAFQKFQRYAHGELEMDEYIEFLERQSTLAEAKLPEAHSPVLPLYGNDAEVFDFRPGRYSTEASIHPRGEWLRIQDLLEWISNDTRFEIVAPYNVLNFLNRKDAGQALRLESPEQPIPVKKQEKYNISRWAVTGQNDLAINTACRRILRNLERASSASMDDWRMLCYLWSSDFRTHITAKRLNDYLQVLKEFDRLTTSRAVSNSSATGLKESTPAFEYTCPGNPPFVPPFGKGGQRGDCHDSWRHPLPGNYNDESVSSASTDCLPPHPQPALPSIAPPTAGKFRGKLLNVFSHDGRYLSIETETLRVSLNCRRGLALDKLWLPGFGREPLLGTIPHGFYEDIALGADYYSGHTILEIPGQPKVTDLNFTEPQWSTVSDGCGDKIRVEAMVPTDLGPVEKVIIIPLEGPPRLTIQYAFPWEKRPLGAFRTGVLTMIPTALDGESLFYRTHNGGFLPETFLLSGCTTVAHCESATSMVSARQGLGATEGVVEFGDARVQIRASFEPDRTCAMPMVCYRKTRESYFFRVLFSLGETDETSWHLNSLDFMPGLAGYRAILPFEESQKAESAPCVYSYDSQQGLNFAVSLDFLISTH